MVHSVMNSKEPYKDIKQTKIKLNNINERRLQQEEGREGGEGREGEDSDHGGGQEKEKGRNK